MLDPLANDPGRHRIDIESLNVAAKPIRLDQSGPSAYERVGDSPTGQIVTFITAYDLRTPPGADRGRASPAGAQTTFERR